MKLQKTMNKEKIKFLIKKHGFVHKIAVATYQNITKGTTKQILHFILKGHIFTYLILLKFKNKTHLKLQVGGGKHTKKGWINADIIGGDIYLNATKKFPFKKNSIDIIFAEQFIEHISIEDGAKFLSECNRVLKKGGIIRLATPDLEKLAKLYLHSNPEVKPEDAIARHNKNHNPSAKTIAHFINDVFRLWGHKFIYDMETLQMLLENSNFKSIQRVKFGESKSITGPLERHADVDWMKNGYQLIIEAKK